MAEPKTIKNRQKPPKTIKNRQSTANQPPINQNRQVVCPLNERPRRLVLGRSCWSRVKSGAVARTGMDSWDSDTRRADGGRVLGGALVGAIHRVGAQIHQDDTAK